MKKMKLSALTLGVGVAMALASSAANAGVMVHLFQWKFNDIANECETVLGPKGFDAVQITPPNEHKQGSDWWVVYQPVSYTNFNSRGGTEAELKSMIQRCKTAGVKIYVDAVFNQMASGSGTGTGGSSYSDRNYPVRHAIPAGVGAASNVTTTNQSTPERSNDLCMSRLCGAHEIVVAHI